MVGLLAFAGIFTALDQTALAVYCSSDGRWVEAQKKLEESGPIVRTSKGV